MINIPTFRLPGGNDRTGQYREDVYPGLEVDIILKQDQRTGKRTRGIVRDLLTSSKFHSRGIKVRLEDGQVGRVAEIIGD
ncbi:MAG: YwbE family protein [Sphingobacteriales bacterium]|nr:MAG: YwbE family protein [Sphingobacteriales bacterium]